MTHHLPESPPAGTQDVCVCVCVEVGAVMLVMDNTSDDQVLRAGPAAMTTFTSPPLMRLFVAMVTFASQLEFC